MRLMRLSGSGEEPFLVERQAPTPVPGAGELPIRVRAAGITPTELEWYPTSHAKTAEKRVGAVPSHEFPGTISALGERLPGLEIGRARCRSIASLSRGAHVVATASERNIEFVKQLGADQVIDYRKERFEDRAGKVDVVFDTVGGETLGRSWAVLKPSGRMVTVAAGGDRAPDDGARQAFFIVEPNARQLGEIGRLLETGALQPVVSAVIPFEMAETAYSRRTPSSRAWGKVVVAVNPE